MTLFFSPALTATYGVAPSPSYDGSINVALLSGEKQQQQTGRSSRRPWKLMFNRHTINIPHTFTDAIFRVKTNSRYFLTNYAIIFLIALFLSLMWPLLSSIVFILSAAAWLFLYFLGDEPLVIFHYTIDDRVVLAILSIITVVLQVLTGSVMNILSSVSIGVAVFVFHTVFRKTEDLCLDDGGVEAGGYLPACSP